MAAASTVAGGEAPRIRRCFTESVREASLAEDVPSTLAYRRFLRGLAAFVGSQGETETAVLQRRDELARADATAYIRRLFDAAGTSELLVDTGYGGPEALSPASFGAAAGRPVRAIIRIETVAQELLARPDSRSLAAFTDRFEAELADALDGGSVGLKTVAAYRVGLRLERVSRQQASRAFAQLDRRRQADRLDDPTLVAHLVWRAAELAAARAIPLQVHTGFGDEDLHLPDADPTLLRALFRDPRTEGCPIVLLHCYPFVRQAAYLASIYPQVHMDLSLAIPLVGVGSAELVAEALGSCPTTKLLAGSDGHSYPEMHWWGARMWRAALAEFLEREVAADRLERSWAVPLAGAVLGGNARRLYRLADHDPRA